MLWLFLSGGAPDVLGIEEVRMQDWDVNDVCNVMLLSASARSNHRRFPRQFTRSRIQDQGRNSQHPSALFPQHPLRRISAYRHFAASYT